MNNDVILDKKKKTHEPQHEKTNKMTVRPEKTQISLGVRPDWSESSLCAQWVVFFWGGCGGEEGRQSFAFYYLLGFRTFPYIFWGMAIWSAILGYVIFGRQGISKPEFYGDLVYWIRKFVGKSKFAEQVRKLINRYKRIGYNPYIMRHTACLVVNPITVDRYASLFNCTAVVRAPDSMSASS